MRTSREIEEDIQSLDRRVAMMRTKMRAFHDELEAALVRERAAELAERPPDFPKPQKLG